jgi:phenylacetate-CoA ligase
LPRALHSAAELACFARLPEDEARAELDGRLRELLARLWRTPHYRRELQARAIGPGDAMGLADLRHLPPLERATLRDSGSDLADVEAPEAFDLGRVRSSGSTGEPVQVLKDGYDTLHMWAVLRFWLEWLEIGLPPRPRVVLLDALPGGLEYSARVPLLGRGALHRISTVRPCPLERLRRVAPAVLFSDPEGLHWLLAQDDPPRPRLLLTSAQRFAPAQRAALAQRTAAPVLDYYSTTETGPIAWACLRTPEIFHVLAPDVWVESEQGELLITRLRPSVLPLLRYRTGDTGTVERDACACGFRGWTIVGFRGRHACELHTPEGREVDAWQLAWVFKHAPLRSFRLTQDGPDGFLLELAEPAGDDLLERLRGCLEVLGFPAPLIRTAPLQETAAKARPFARTWDPGTQHGLLP